MASPTRIVSAEAQGLYKVFNPGQPTKARYDGTTLRITGGSVKSLANSEIGSVDLDLRLLHHAIIITLNNGTKIELSGFKEQPVRELHSAITQGVKHYQETEHRKRQASLQEQVRKLESDIKALHPQLPALIPKNSYLRKSQAIKAANQITALTSRCTPDLAPNLSQSGKKLLDDIKAAEIIVAKETNRSQANQKYVDAQAKKAARAGVKLGYRELTQEQAQAAATDEDVTLVAAGAGTGKTTVITGKLAHLVTDQKVKPEHILVLAYNNNAAKDIRDTLPTKLQGIDVATFHSFGRKVIGQTTEMPTVSNMANDTFRIRSTMESFIREMTQDDQLARAILNFLVNMPSQYKSPFDDTMETEADYQHYIKNSELRTLKGDLVKSFEELTIANWLAANDVAYEYEKQYEIRTASNQYRQYQPDFYLTDYGIYIEHFALDEEGHAPPGWVGYEQGAIWKRSQHSQNKTVLVETYSWEHKEGKLLEHLAEKLDQHNVKRRTVPVQDLIKELNGLQISRLADLLTHFLNHAKSSNISQAQIDYRATSSQDPRRANEFLKIWRCAREKYDAQLEAENAIDFHDMINQATSIITRGQWQHQYTHVLIDEFQDISPGRMALAKALQSEGMAYFLVGDDWQSIYRFTGSQVRLFNEVQEYLGFTKKLALTQTFRFGDDIARPSALFIQQNPDQTRREFKTANEQGKSSLIVIADANQRQGANTALDQIKASCNPSDSTLILGRFRLSRDNLPAWAQKNFSTVHGAKGREADYVVVLDLADDIYGFPCLREDDPLLDLVAPPIDDAPYPNAEERRLFYVGMTRGKKATYLVADPNRPSPFIRELLQLAPEVRELGQLSPGCPACKKGHLVRSQTGQHLRCTNYPGCRHLAPRCTVCKNGYAVSEANPVKAESTTRCTNNDCQHRERTCPSCGLGILTIRESSRTGSRFWACSEWRGGEGCTFTEDAPQANVDQNLKATENITVKGN